ncbi:MAG: CRISPR-associated endonuclease Cas2 [Lentisphaeria bacterium]|nr:CRISPR-associated endonuclease Cas2 [Lentisphaeria bacterium]
MAYDITDRKRLKRVSKLLMRYGKRVQKSVFACDINERRLRELESKLRTEKQDGDSIMIFEYRAENAKGIERETGGHPRDAPERTSPAERTGRTESKTPFGNATGARPSLKKCGKTWDFFENVRKKRRGSA